MHSDVLYPNMNTEIGQGYLFSLKRGVSKLDDFLVPKLIVNNLLLTIHSAPSEAKLFFIIYHSIEKIVFFKMSSFFLNFYLRSGWNSTIMRTKGSYWETAFLSPMLQSILI
jgi:hypothetical protein